MLRSWVPTGMSIAPSWNPVNSAFERSSLFGSGTAVLFLRPLSSRESPGCRGQLYLTGWGWGWRFASFLPAVARPGFSPTGITAVVLPGPSALVWAPQRFFYDASEQLFYKAVLFMQCPLPLFSGPALLSG